MLNFKRKTVNYNVYLIRGGEIGGGAGGGGFSPPTLETRGAEPPPLLSYAHTTKLQQHSSVIILGVCKEC